MKILITGCLGFVGTNLVLHLLKKGHTVLGIDSRFKREGSSQNLELTLKKGLEYQYCDIRNYNDIFNTLKNKERIDIVYHFASQVSFKNSISNPRLDFEVNLLGTFNLLEYIRQHSPNTKFVYASTNQVYGNLEKIDLVESETRFDFKTMKKGVPENYPLDYLSPYGCSKGGGEIYCIDYSRVYDLKIAIARFGGIYGVNQYSSEDHGWVAYITNMIRTNQQYRRFGHGKQVRDILYISDLVTACEKIGESKEKLNCQIYNVAGGPTNTLSVLELIKLIEHLTGNKSKDEVLEMRKADKVVMYLDIEKAKKELNWHPKVSYIEGLKKLLSWQEKG